MSVQASSWVIKNSRQKGSALLLMLMIANHAHADGTNAFPSIQTLAHECRMSVRQVVRLIAQLEKSGELLIERSKGRTVHNYTINMAANRDKVSPSNPDKMSVSTVTSEAANRDKSGTSTMTNTVSTLYIEPSIEPSIEPEEDAPASGILDVATELTIQQTEKAFSIRLDLDTRRLIAEAVPAQLAALWPGFIKGRAVGYSKRTDREKLARISYAITDFQKDNQRFLNNGNNYSGYKSERDKQGDRVRQQRAEEDELFRIGLAKREAEARRALSGDSEADDSAHHRLSESTATR